MPKFKVTDKVACWVTWTYVIEAIDEDDALEKYYEGDHGETEADPEIGDSLDWAGDGTQVEKLPEEAS